MSKQKAWEIKYVRDCFKCFKDLETEMSKAKQSLIFWKLGEGSVIQKC